MEAHRGEVRAVPAGWVWIGYGVMSITWISGCEDLEVTTAESNKGGAYSYCGPSENWKPEWELFEEDIVDLINEERALGADCHSRGVFAPAGPLASNDEVRCAARGHSQDMAERGYFDHTNPEGKQPWDRMADEGYEYVAAGENIAAGYPTPEEAVDAWMESDGHCANLMNPIYVHTGVGFYQRETTVYTYYWTQDFGSPSSRESASP